MMGGMKLDVSVIIINTSTQQKKETVTVPHPKKDFPIRTAKSIFKQAGINDH